MDKVAFDSFLEILDDAVAIAKEAVEVASKAPAPEAPKISLTKVASETYEKTAKSLARTGLFPGKSVVALQNDLRNGGESYCVSLLEKLASSAVFPMFDDNVVDGSLVEKSASGQSYSDLPKQTAIWRKAMDEAEEELS